MNTERVSVVTKLGYSNIYTTYHTTIQYTRTRTHISSIYILLAQLAVKLKCEKFLETDNDIDDYKYAQDVSSIPTATDNNDMRDVCDVLGNNVFFIVQSSRLLICRCGWKMH